MADIDNLRLTERPAMWDDEAPDGVLNPFEGDDGAAGEALSLLGLPEVGRKAKSRDLAGLGEASAPVLDMLGNIADALDAAREGRAWRRRLDHLSVSERTVLQDALGKGEVSMTLSPGAPGEGLAQIGETVLPGVWLGLAEDTDGAPAAHWVEVADAPRALREAAAARPRDDIPFDALTPPRDAMNVMGVLAEIRARAAAWRPGTQNHVLNFTLFPMTQADTAFLAKVLGEAGVRVSSGGYGAARVIMTALRNVWAVQYLNGLGAVILDTIEVGDVPASVLASVQDFEDSAARLDEIRQAYVS